MRIRLKLTQIIFLLMCLFISLTSCNTYQNGNKTFPQKDFSNSNSFSDYVCEVFDYSGNNFINYLNKDNTKTLRIYSSCVYNNIYLTENSQEWSCSVNGLSAILPKVISESCGISIQYSGEMVVIYPRDNHSVKGVLQSDYQNVYSYRSDAIVYDDFFGNNLDLVCIVTQYGINFELKLKDVSVCKNDISYCIQVDDCYPDISSNDYIALNSLNTKETKAIVYSPSIVDKGNRWFIDCKSSFVNKQGNKYTIKIDLNSYLNNKQDLNFTLILNQSICIYQAKQPDVAIYSKESDTKHYLSQYVSLGQDTQKGIGELLVRYESLNNISIDPNRIVSAKYYIHCLSAVDSKQQLKLYAVEENWCSINATWNVKPALSENKYAVSCLEAGGNFVFDITKLLKEEINNKKASDSVHTIRNGFAILAENDDSNLLLALGDNGIVSPLLEIVYGKSKKQFIGF